MKLAKIVYIGITDVRRNSDRVLNHGDEVADCRGFGNNYNDAMDTIGTHLFNLHVSNFYRTGSLFAFYQDMRRYSSLN